MTIDVDAEHPQQGASHAVRSRYVEHNYLPHSVVISRAEGIRVFDTDDREYIDCLSTYSAVNFGHLHPELVAAAKSQLDVVSLTSRVYQTEALSHMVDALASLTGTEAVFPHNTGAEAIEASIKIARAWAYKVKGVPAGRAEIIVAHGNFHGASITLTAVSDEAALRASTVPYPPGFVHVPFGDVEALQAAITPNTAAVLLEPIQAETGVTIPPDGYLQQVRTVTEAAQVLLIVDEIQSGLGRTGETLASSGVFGVTADLVVLGKALGGGLVPASAVVGRADVIGVFREDTHGFTFGGNPLAAAIVHRVVDLLETGEPQLAARERGSQLRAGLDSLVGNGVAEIRSQGLWFGIDIEPTLGSGHDLAERLMHHGILAKGANDPRVQLAPPLIITNYEVDGVLAAFEAALGDLRRR